MATTTSAINGSSVVGGEIIPNVRRQSGVKPLGKAHARSDSVDEGDSHSPARILDVTMTKGESVSAYVTRSLDIIDESGLAYQLTPMETIIEGQWLQVIGQLQPRAILRRGSSFNEFIASHLADASDYCRGCLPSEIFSLCD